MDFHKFQAREIMIAIVTFEMVRSKLKYKMIIWGWNLKSAENDWTI